MKDSAVGDTTVAIGDEDMSPVVEGEPADGASLVDDYAELGESGTEILRRAAAEVIVPGELKDFTSPNLGEPIGVSHPAWNGLPYICTVPETQLMLPGELEPGTMQSLGCEIQLAHNDDSLFLRIRTYDFEFDPTDPSGVIQLSLRDASQEVNENEESLEANGLISIQITPNEERMYRQGNPDQEGVVLLASIPWEAMGSLRPEENEPFHLRILTHKPDDAMNALNAESEGWAEAFEKAFVSKPSAVKADISFASGITYQRENKEELVL
jgi:hypothetical protein